MRKLLLFISLLFISQVKAETISGIIHSVDDIPENQNRIIKLTNGRVLYFEKSQNFNFHEGDAFDFVSDDAGNLLSVKPSFFPDENFTDLPFKSILERPVYEPTILSESELNIVWSRMNPNYKPVSECTNRAHVWAYEEHNRSGLKSMKQFVFFTASYINRNRFKWWFHVAPMVKVNVKGEIQERVLDFRYSHRPQSVKEWTDLYVHSKRPCKITTKFSEYDVNPQTEECYQISTPMYYWQPGDIKNEETIQKYKMNFSKSEINAAYSEAFRR